MRAIIIISLVMMLGFKKSDHFDGKKFFNPEGPDVKSFWSLIKWQLTGHKVEWPTHVSIKNFPLRPLTPTEKVSATFINHATFLIQIPGLNILTDPIYSERASPVKFAGPKRVRNPGIPFEVLPPIDVVLVSHNHYDHLDIESLQMIDKKFHPLFLVPLGDEKLLKEAGVQNVKELDWWEEVKVKGTKFTFAPSQHWSARGFFDKNESLWGSFMLDTEVSKIYFAGDTGYGKHFLDIKNRLGEPHLALLPIGAYKPRWFMQNHHMCPEEAVKAHLDLGSKQSIAMHFGTFQLSDEGVYEPVRDLIIARNKMKISDKFFRILKQGQALSF